LVFLILNIILVPSLWISKYLFKKWINPLSSYTIVWYAMISFYHLKLIKYDELSVETWYVIIIAYVSFFLGIIGYFASQHSIKNSKIDINCGNEYPKTLFISRENSKIFFGLTLLLGLLGLLGALQAWIVLLSLYGSVTKVLLHLGALYQMRVSGELEGILPYTSIFSFASIFFAGIHSATKSRITLVSLLPLVALIIKEVAMVGRAGILFGFVEYGFTFLFASSIIRDNFKIASNNKAKLILSVTISVILFLASITFIKNLRGGSDSYSGKTRAIKALEGATFISPSIYLYLSGHIGVLNKYLEKDIEKARFGENTFQLVYNSLNKFEITSRPNGYQKGYYIPLWVNTGTFIRELLADFGIVGTMLFIYLLGYLVTHSWVRFFSNNNIVHLAILVFLMIIIFFSFLMVITRLANWFLSLGVIFGILKFFEFYLYKSIEKDQISKENIL